MQTASCIDDRLDTVSLGTPLTALLVSVLAHGMLLWILPGDNSLSGSQVYQAGSIMVRIAHRAPSADADVEQSTESETEEAEQVVATSSAPPADAAGQASAQAAPQPVVEQKASQMVGLAVLEPPRRLVPAQREQARVTAAVSPATQRYKPKAAVVPVQRPPARSVQSRRTARARSSTVKAPERTETRAASALSSLQVPVREAGFSITSVYSPEPAYPRLARRLGLEGVVTLRITVASGGVADNVEVLASSGHAIFDRAAVAAVRNWRFRVSGVPENPAASSIDVPIRFQLN